MTKKDIAYDFFTTLNKLMDINSMINYDGKLYMSVHGVYAQMYAKATNHKNITTLTS